jgi:hypothetical protein
LLIVWNGTYLIDKKSCGVQNTELPAML